MWNSVFPLPKAEILNALKEIADTTEDKILKTQIKERLDAEREAARRFQGNDDGGCFFICKPSDEDSEEEESCYFTTLETAVAYGKEESCGIFYSEKKIFEDCCVNDDLDQAYAVGCCAWYTKDGEMVHCACFPYMFGIRGVINHRGSSRFEDAYVPLQDPFEAGDIVRIAGDSRPAIVQQSRERWYSLLERNVREPRGAFINYIDTCLRVEFLREDGEMFHDHPYFLSLKKVEQWEEELEWNLLQQAGWLIRGRGDMDGFLYCYHKNLERKRKE